MHAFTTIVVSNLFYLQLIVRTRLPFNIMTLVHLFPLLFALFTLSLVYKTVYLSHSLTLSIQLKILFLSLLPLFDIRKCLPRSQTIATNNLMVSIILKRKWISIWIQTPWCLPKCVLISSQTFGYRNNGTESKQWDIFLYLHMLGVYDFGKNR